VILTVVFIFHQRAKRQQAKASLAVAEADAMTAENRANEMERLVAFGQALGRSLDTNAIETVVVEQLPELAGSSEAWVMTRADNQWRVPASSGRESRTDLERNQRPI